MKILTVVGARPQFVKAAAISRHLREQHTEILVHTGQHYDPNMSQVFFEELRIPLPNYNLNAGSGKHGAQTSLMLAKIEEILFSERPDAVLIYGDTNSTLAAALAASKIHIPIVHIEAGLRSYNRAMPEEINRVISDHLSFLLLCPSEQARRNLASEGIVKGVFVVGDVMADVLEAAKQPARERARLLPSLYRQEYVLATVHRAETTDDPQKLRQIATAFSNIKSTIVLPLHPRTKKLLSAHGITLPSNVKVVEPLGYIDMIAAEMGARLILTDSGGIQKEAYWLQIPCITLRTETEWVETVEAGWNVLAGADPKLIADTANNFQRPGAHPDLYGDGHSAERCLSIIERELSPLTSSAGRAPNA